MFLAFWSANLLSAVGTQIQVVAAAWLMTLIAASPGDVAFVSTASSMPMLFFALFAGALVDMFDRRRVLLIAQGIRVAGAVVLSVCAAQDVVTPELLLLCTFVIGIGFALNAPAWQAAVRDLVDRREVPAAIAANALALNVGRMGGPAIGGAIIAMFGVSTAFAANSLSFIPLVAVLLLWRRSPDVRTTPREAIFPAVRAGLRYARHTPIVRSILWRDIFYGASGAGIFSLIPLIATERLATGPVGYGLLVAALGTGSILGGVLTPRLQQGIGATRLVRGGLAMTALATCVVAVSSNPVVLHLGVFAVGAATVVVLNTFNAVIQLSVANWVTGRVVAQHQAFLFGGLSLGSLIWGVVASHAGLGWAIGGAGLLPAMLLFASRGFEPSLNHDERLEGAPSSVPLPVPPEQFSQPVSVSIEYRIPADQLPAFQAAMAERGEARRRDGARDWTLSLSPQDPELWVERYGSRSWTDHLRYRARRTRADALLQDAIVALHSGDLPPLVRYELADGSSFAMRAPDWHPVTERSAPSVELTL